MALLLQRMPALGGLQVASTVNGSGRCLPLDGQRIHTIEETPVVQSRQLESLPAGCYCRA